jgi:hypothetical protein
MNNADMPAMPTGLVDEDVFNSEGKFCGTVEAKYVGLTKREHFAGLAMQGILSNSVMGDSALHEKHEDWVKDISDSSLQFADALLAEIDKVVR